MPKSYYIWSDDRKARLRELWTQGMSAQEIAERLGGGLSRSAVIGKANRSGLSKPSPSSITRLRRRAVAKAEAEAESAAEQRTSPTAGISLLALLPDSCRFILGNVDDRPILFCGEKKVRGESWCEKHQRIISVKPPRKGQGKLLRSDRFVGEAERAAQESRRLRHEYMSASKG